MLDSNENSIFQIARNIFFVVFFFVFSFVLHTQVAFAQNCVSGNLPGMSCFPPGTEGYTDYLNKGFHVKTSCTIPCVVPPLGDPNFCRGHEEGSLQYCFDPEELASKPGSSNSVTGCQCKNGVEWCTYTDGKSYRVEGSESKCASPGNSSGSGSSVGGSQSGAQSSSSDSSVLDEDVTDLEEVTVTAKGCPDGTTMKNNLCVPTGTGLSEVSVQQLLLKFLNWLLAIIGFLALLAFLISGAQYLLAFGDDGMIETAKNNMKWSIVGVAVAFGSYVIVQAVGMLFN